MILYLWILKIVKHLILLLINLLDEINLKRSYHGERLTFSFPNNFYFFFLLTVSMEVFHFWEHEKSILDLHKEQWHYLEALKVPKGKNGKNIHNLEITEVLLVHCNIVSNDYQQNSRVLYTFVLNKSFAQLLNILPTNFNFFSFKGIFNLNFKTFNSWPQSFSLKVCKPYLCFKSS